MRRCARWIPPTCGVISQIKSGKFVRIEPAAPAYKCDDGPYHGGQWAVFEVTFVQGVDPYLLTSDEAVFAAQQAGDVTVNRDAGADFHCPVLP